LPDNQEIEKCEADRGSEMGECMELGCMEFLDDDVDNGEGILNDAS